MDKVRENLFQLIKVFFGVLSFFFIVSFISHCTAEFDKGMKAELEKEKKATAEKNRFSNVPALNANVVMNKFKQFTAEKNYIIDKMEILDVSAVNQEAIYVKGFAGAVVQEIVIIARTWGTDNDREDTQFEHDDKYIIEFNMKRTLSSVTDFVPGVVIENNKPSDWDVAGILNIVEFKD